MCRVSIIPRSVGALGHTLQLPTEERYLMTLPELEDQITVMMGGQAAEESIHHRVISTEQGTTFNACPNSYVRW